MPVTAGWVLLSYGVRRTVDVWFFSDRVRRLVEAGLHLLVHLRRLCKHGVYGLFRHAVGSRPGCFPPFGSRACMLLARGLVLSPCWGASCTEGLVASPCTLVENGECAVSLVCSCLQLGGGLVASPFWGTAVSTAADSGVSTSSFRAADKPSWSSPELSCCGL